jgi:hypothetical protein
MMQWSPWLWTVGVHRQRPGGLAEAEGHGQRRHRRAARAFAEPAVGDAQRQRAGNQRGEHVLGLEHARLVAVIADVVKGQDQLRGIGPVAAAGADTVGVEQHLAAGQQALGRGFGGKAIDPVQRGQLCGADKAAVGLGLEVAVQAAQVQDQHRPGKAVDKAHAAFAFGIQVVADARDRAERVAR